MQVQNLFERLRAYTFNKKDVQKMDKKNGATRAIAASANDSKDGIV